jgi:hypothetical protein
MVANGSRPIVGHQVSKPAVALALLSSTTLASTPARSDEDDFPFRPGHLLLSRTVYDNKASSITTGVTQLPLNCVAPNCATAAANGTYPMVFNNDLVDASFGITAKIILDERLNGERIRSLEVPNGGQHGATSNKDQMVTSFPSKSEIALNLSVDHHSVSFMGYVAPTDAINVSNSNTPDTGLPWSPATDGLPNIIGRVNPDGTATIWAITSTVSGGGDQGADPNRLVMIRDKLAATKLPASETFATLRTARFAEALRGVSFTPGSGLGHDGVADERGSCGRDHGDDDCHDAD